MKTLLPVLLKSKFLLIFLSVFYFQFGISQNVGDVDMTLNSTDVGFGFGDGTDGYSYSVEAVLKTVVQPDGKIIIGGKFTKYNYVGRNRIARLNSDGTIDRSFAPNGGANNIVHSLALQSDGKIIAVGEFTRFNNISMNRIVRLNQDGSLDTNFNVGTGFNANVYSVTIQDDGKILIGGEFSSYNGVSSNRIVRLNSNGSVDSTFTSGIEGVPARVFAIAVQPNGKILIGGVFAYYNNNAVHNIARLNSDGSQDTSFYQAQGADAEVYSIVLQSDQKILVGGLFSGINSSVLPHLARLNSDGRIDTSFNVGEGADKEVHSISLQSDGKIIIGGKFTTFNNVAVNRIARINTDGTLDASFITNTGPNSIIYDVFSVVVQQDNKILVGGAIEFFNGTGRNRIVRLNSDSSLDVLFNPGFGANRRINSIATQQDGKILIGGEFSAYNDVKAIRIARINSNGSLDTSFNPVDIAGFIKKVLVQPDGKILIGGTFSYYDGTYKNGIVRLNTDGSLDNTFNPGTGMAILPGKYINAIALQPDGKILIGGDFTSYNDISRNRIARLNSDGSLDATFNLQGTDLNGSIYSIAVQSDGKILIGGDFSRSTSTLRGGIARLNANGVLDSSVNSNATIWDRFIVNSIVLQPDSKIVIAGDFTIYNGITRNGLARLNVDGSLDSSFDTSASPSWSFNEIALRQDGKIVAVGYSNESNVTIWNNDGSLNFMSPSVQDGAGTPGARIFGVALQQDNKILIGGLFTSYNEIGRNRVARLHGSSNLGLEDDTEYQDVKIYPNPVQDVLNINLSENLFVISYEIYDLLGKKVLFGGEIENSIKMSGLERGVYILRIQTNQGTLTKKIVKG
ncbi:MAG TPA: T9SS type A sorting domain-containing protein [Flavobacterium sp.]|uniref:T9SS type A sorting domain-containing protein n=1 Tax=Flavobacterium sp. TaxID=239 RepID=UPI002BDA35F4|nr:T9SS type A sorting domain-containing protein [Flavobacterium sp.]HSD14282.1 T9SS type A sorting domain-containing protein [Flavobacterium sp.]